MKKNKQINIKRLQLYDKIGYSSLIFAVILAIIRRLFKSYFSIEIIKFSLYVSVFLGLIFIIFSLVKFIEKNRIEKKVSNYDEF